MHRDLEVIYKNETGKDASHEKQDEWNAYRTDKVFYYDYINWLEDLANKALDSDAKQRRRSA